MTLLHVIKQVDYTFISPTVSTMAVKAGHYQFEQYFLSTDRGMFIHVLAGDLFGS